MNTNNITAMANLQGRCQKDRPDSLCGPGRTQAGSLRVRHTEVYHIPVFTKLYDSLVQPILDYSAAIWGHKAHSCIQAVQNQAIWFYLGVGRRTPTVALQGELGWACCGQRQWMCITRHWCRLSSLAEWGINKTVFKWVYASEGKRNSRRHIMDFYNNIGMNHLSNINNNLLFNNIKEDMELVLHEHYEGICSSGSRGGGG